jgi:hypothetical protein
MIGFMIKRLVFIQMEKIIKSDRITEVIA